MRKQLPRIVYCIKQHRNGFIAFEKNRIGFNGGEETAIMIPKGLLTVYTAMNINAHS